MNPLRHTLLSLSLLAVASSTAGCQGAMSEEDQDLGEASSYLTLSEETGEAAGDSVALESPETLTSSAEDTAALPELPADADGVCDLRGARQRVLARYDDNGNGQLDPAERVALRRDLVAMSSRPMAARFVLRHRAAVMTRVRWAFDENGDGVLSSDERTALVDALQARCERRRAELLSRFDANGDGTLDATERAAVKAALVAKVQAQRQALLARYDANGNGVLDDGERVALRNDLVAAWQAKRAQVVTQFDANGNGALDAGERMTLKQALQQRIAEGRDADAT
jgi:hypothetical protein